ncbi:MAG: HAD family hydrolase [Terriglobales bacterium]
MTGPTSAPIRLSRPAAEFVESVVRLHPRLAVFDCDGTLWAGDAGEQFLNWTLDRKLLPQDVDGWIRARYADYKAGKVSEEAICGEMVTIYKGLHDGDLMRTAEEFFEAKFKAAIFPEMLELTHRLAQAGCELWAVSSTNEWVVRVGIRDFGIPNQNVLAACVHIENGRATGRLLRVPTGADKATAVRDVIKRPADAAFGNSIHDAAMLEIARHAFAINANADLQEIARQRGWTVYSPQRNLGAE